MDELRKEHDEIISNKPDNVSEADFAALVKEHKIKCSICTADLAEEDSQEGGDMDKEFTKEEVDAAVEAALTPLQAELEALKSQIAEGEVDTRVADAKADGDARVAAVQAQLDEAVNAKGAAETELANVLEFLKTEVELQEIASYLTDLKADRRTVLVENSNMDESYIDENLDRWVALDEEVFNSFVEGLKASKTEKKVVEGEGEVAKLDTAMNNTRVEKADSTREDLSNLFAARSAGYNVKRI